MNTKKQIITLHLVRSIMILLMMGWTGGAWAQNGTVSEEVIYTTDFTDWTKEINRKEANQVVVNKQTEFGDTFSFTLNGVGIYPKSIISSNQGYMQTAKYTSEYSAAQPSVVTSALKSITQTFCRPINRTLSYISSLIPYFYFLLYHIFTSTDLFQQKI